MNYSDAKFLACIYGILRDRAAEPSKLLGMAQDLCQYEGILREKCAAMKFSPTTRPASESNIALLCALHELADVIERNAADRPALLQEYLAKKTNDLKDDEKNIKIAFLTHEYSCWPSFKPIYDHLSKLEHIDAQIIVSYSINMHFANVFYDLNFYKSMLNDYRNAGYREAFSMYEYNIAVESPDIVFFMKPYYCRGNMPYFQVNDVEKHTPYTVYVPYCLDTQGGKELIKYFYQLAPFYHFWRIIGYSNIYKKMHARYGYRNGENVMTIGHPKFDIAYDASHARSSNCWHDAVKGRPAVLWNTHFSIEEDVGVGTYFLYKDVVFEYFKQHNDIVLIWRPHPIFWQRIMKQSQEVVRDFKKTLNGLAKYDNIIIDKQPDYLDAFSVSTAMISDATTFLLEYRASGNPVLYTSKPGGERVSHEEYLEGIVEAEGPEDIISFLEAVRTGQTAEMRAASVQSFNRILGHSDGRVSERICDYVLKEMDADLQRRAESLFISLQNEGRRERAK